MQITPFYIFLSNWIVHHNHWRDDKLELLLITPPILQDVISDFLSNKSEIFWIGKISISNLFHFFYWTFYNCDIFFYQVLNIFKRMKDLICSTVLVNFLLKNSFTKWSYSIFFDCHVVCSGWKMIANLFSTTVILTRVITI